MSMTFGKDVSSLFPDVLKNIATADLDQKKLVYLYLMYALATKSSNARLTIRTGTMRSHIQTYVSSP